MCQRLCLWDLFNILGSRGKELSHLLLHVSGDESRTEKEAKSGCCFWVHLSHYGKWFFLVYSLSCVQWTTSEPCLQSGSFPLLCNPLCPWESYTWDSDWEQWWAWFEVFSGMRSQQELLTNHWKQDGGCSPVPSIKWKMSVTLFITLLINFHSAMDMRIFNLFHTLDLL